MNVLHFVIADHVQAAGGKLFISGAGWRTIRLPEFPGRASLGFGIVIDFDATEAGSHDLVLMCETDGPTGTQVLRVEGSLHVQINDLAVSARSVVGMNAVTQLPKPGVYRVVLTVDGEARAQSTFEAAED